MHKFNPYEQFELLKEKRLAMLADNSNKGANTQETAKEEEEEEKEDKAKKPEDKKDKHDEKQEKIDAEKKKLKDLQDKVDKSNLTSETKKLAKSAIDSGDADEIALVEKLVDKGIDLSQAKFKSELEKIREKKRKVKTDDIPTNNVKNQIKTLLLDKLKMQNPDAEKDAEKFSRTVKHLDVLNKQELAVKDNILKKLDAHVKAGKITKENADKLAAVDPRDKLAREKIKELLGPLAKDATLLQFVLTEKQKQAKIVDDFEKAWEVAEKILEEALGPYEIAKKRRDRLKFLSRVTGIDIVEGNKIEYIGLDSGLKGVRKTTTIEKVDFVTHKVNYLKPEEIDDEYAKILQEESRQMPNTVLVTFSYEMPDGTIVRDTLDERKFLMWANQNQAKEIFANQADLEDRIGFAEFGQKLKDGMKLDYIAGRKGDENPLIETVTIDRIDKENQIIHLDAPVPMVGHTEQHEDESVVAKKYKKDLTFGEFAKFFRLTRAEESMKLDRARELLKKQPSILNNRYPSIDKSVWEFNKMPIEIYKNEKLIIGNGNRVTISDVSDKEIKLDNGLKFTPGQFFRFAKEHEVEKAARVPEQAEIEKKVTDLLGHKNSKKNEDATKPAEPASSGRVGLLYSIWKNVTFLSLKDIWKLIETTIEFVKRKHERNVKKRAGGVGQNLPGRWGAEFRNLAESAEHEEVNKYKEEMSDLDIWVIKERLYNTSDQDEAKAAFLLLTEKGLLNFEDPKVWATMNRIMKKGLSDGDYLAYRIDPKTHKNKAGEVGPDALKQAIDKLWGAPTGTDWYSKNDSAFNSGVESFKSDANDYENDYKNVGGVAAELHNMLVKHKRGEYVNPHRYESFIRFIIEAGKAEIEDKVYYLVAGITTENPQGETILSKQRHAAIDGKYLNQLPFLDFFTRFKVNGEGERFPKEFAEGLMKDWDVKDVLNKRDAAQRYNKEKVRKFIWENMMTFGSVLQRLNKGTRGAENMDHDDAHLMIPMADESLILQAVVTNSRGQRSAFTTEGLANGIAGYTHYLMSLANLAELPPEERKRMAGEGYQDPTTLIKKTFKGFVAFESVVNKRNFYSKDWQRLSSEMMDRNPIVDGAKTTRQHMDETKSVLKKILRAYGMSEKQIYDYIERRDVKGSDEAKEHEKIMATFSDTFDKLIAQQGADKMVKILIAEKNAGRLNGFEGEDMTNKKEFREQREQAMQAATQAEAAEAMAA